MKCFMKEAKEILSEALGERVANNPSYSLRAFARDLGMSPQLLSNVINGRRGLGAQLAENVAEKLDLTEFERTLFLESFKAKFSRSKTQRIVAQSKLKNAEFQSHSKSLELDLFKTVSNWYHFTLLELIKISQPHTQTPAWFSRKLDLSENEITLSLARLERLELISKLKRGWKVNQDTVIADQGISSEAVRNFHRQILEKAMSSLTTQTSSERYGSSSTIPVRVQNLDKAKKMIRDFRLKFDREISDPEHGDEVYGLSFQFFRLTQKEEHSK